MEPLVRHKGKVACLNRVNVDTDQIIPKQFLKRIEKSGYDPFLFYDWRYLENGEINEQFELNQGEVQGASILVAGDNFGCGSSREHAVWALRDYGFRILLAPSFADIFYNNCFKNGVLPIRLNSDSWSKLAPYFKGEERWMTVDLERQEVEICEGMVLSFEIDPHRKQMLVEGLDDIGLTMRYQQYIDIYEKEQMAPYQRVYD
jgi:3-isopropylmalate/(R)-2-methylmalate dehydratase small subunit